MERFLQNLISYGFSYLIAGRKNYGFWKSKNYSFRSAKIKNQKLAQELEDACQKNKGFLTYCEFLDIDQFGKNGYHAKNVMHGMTNTHKNWSKTLAFLCKEKGLDQIVELGPGDGKLAIKILKEAKKMGSEVFWSGVEVNEKLREEIKKRFKKEGLDNNLKIITDSLKNIPSNLKALVTFSYSLDSISPEIFINTSETKIFS